MVHYMSSLSLSRLNPCRLYFSTGHLKQNYPGFTTCKSCCFLSGGSRTSENCSLSFTVPNQKGSYHPVTMTTSVSSAARQLHIGMSSNRRSMKLMLSVPPREKGSHFSWSTRFTSWTVGGASAGMCLSFSTSSVRAEAPGESNSENGGHKTSLDGSSHGKKVHTDYSVTGIPGDGRCLFRSVAHGACIRAGQPFPSDTHQRELADELRGLVADEFVKRRADSEWFVEGDFDTYVEEIRKPHVWGGEPELFMASHVLQMPITVYMHDEASGGLIAIAEYGQEYGKEDPIRVLYHGFGHYDALVFPAQKLAKPRL